MDKPEILKHIMEGRADFDACLDAIPDSQFDSTRNQSGWTAKDTLAHISSWEKRMLTWMLAASRGETPTIPEPGATWADLNRINTRALAFSRTQSIEQVRADARDTHQALVDVIHALPDNPGSESWSVWLNQEPPWKLIAANTYEHYAHHLKACCKIGRYPGEW